MNYSTLASLIDEKITYVSCSFVNLDKQPKGFQGKLYTYKTTLTDVKVGDLLLVHSIANDKPFDCAVVQVVETDVVIDYSNDINYKWAFQK